MRTAASSRQKFYHNETVLDEMDLSCRKTDNVRHSKSIIQISQVCVVAGSILPVDGNE